MAHAQIIEGTGEELIPLLTRHPAERFRLIRLAEESEYESFEIAFGRATNRTSSEVETSRSKLLALAQPPRGLTDGRTLAESIMGKWPGDETDEQIVEALKKLS